MASPPVISLFDLMETGETETGRMVWLRFAEATLALVASSGRLLASLCRAKELDSLGSMAEDLDWPFLMALPRPLSSAGFGVGMA